MKYEKQDIYKELDFELVPSNHRENSYYRVSFGVANWQKKEGSENYVYVVFMQYNDSISFKNEGIIKRMPAHIMSKDLPNVLDALSNLKKKHL